MPQGIRGFSLPKFTIPIVPPEGVPKVFLNRWFGTRKAELMKIGNFARLTRFKEGKDGEAISATAAGG